MPQGPALAEPVRRWGVIVAAGGIGFAIGIAGLTWLGLDGILRIPNDLPVAAVAGGLLVVLALAASTIAAFFAVVRGLRHGRVAMVAIDNMTQGLSMFDGAARLVVCNRRYIEMSRLPPENFRPGTPLRQILIRRAAAGHFEGDPDQYVADALKRAATGVTETRVFELADGRTISLIVRPLADGGWVSTHTDITQQRVAERERDSLRQREIRGAAVDAAIVDFRARIESMLTTVAQSGAAMKAAAKSLLATSDHTLQRAEGAVQGSNEASANVETVAAAAEELSASIKEISRQLAQRTKPCTAPPPTRPSPTTTSPHLPASRRGSATW
jgi:PAS domain-containing protein